VQLATPESCIIVHLVRRNGRHSHGMLSYYVKSKLLLIPCRVELFTFLLRMRSTSQISPRRRIVCQSWMWH
jgi:hypothetical protein